METDCIYFVCKDCGVNVTKHNISGSYIMKNLCNVCADRFFNQEILKIIDTASSETTLNYLEEFFSGLLAQKYGWTESDSKQILNHIHYKQKTITKLSTILTRGNA